MGFYSGDLTPGLGTARKDAIIPSRHQRAMEGFPTQWAPEHAFKSSNWILQGEIIIFKKQHIYLY